MFSKLNFRGIGGLLTVALLPAVLASCTSPTQADSRQSATEAIRPAHTVTVLLSKGDTKEAIQQQFDGEILVWHGFGGVLSDPTESGADYLPFAILTVDSQGGQPATLSTASASFCDANVQLASMDETTVCLEANEPVLKAGGIHDDHLWAAGHSVLFDTVSLEGRSTIWNEGRSTLWNEGRSTLWNEGGTVFDALPENTDLWQYTNLRTAQDESLASQLGNGVTVAVIDTGVDLDHPILRDGLTEPDTWLDLVDGDRWPAETGSFENPATPGYGHGTAVAGIVRQIAPNARILPIRVLHTDGTGYVTDVIAAIVHALDHGASVINLSLGGTIRSQALSQVLGLATQQGVHVIMSAGNSGMLVDA